LFFRNKVSKNNALHTYWIESIFHQQQLAQLSRYLSRIKLQMHNIAILSDIHLTTIQKLRKVKYKTGLFTHVLIYSSFNPSTFVIIKKRNKHPIIRNIKFHYLRVRTLLIVFKSRNQRRNKDRLSSDQIY
jgi:hypothetical protein